MFMLSEGRLLVAGLVAWAVGAGLLRGAGHLLLPPALVPAAVLLAITVIAFAALAHFLFRHIPPATRGSGALALILPTLVLDGFSAVFFPQVFPNLPEAVVGVFAGWMMLSCAGVAIGTLLHSSR
jgi:hypothetical protein